MWRFIAMTISSAPPAFTMASLTSSFPAMAFRALSTCFTSFCKTHAAQQQDVCVCSTMMKLSLTISSSSPDNPDRQPGVRWWTPARRGPRCPDRTRFSRPDGTEWHRVHWALRCRLDELKTTRRLHQAFHRCVVCYDRTILLFVISGGWSIGGAVSPL